MIFKSFALFFLYFLVWITLCNWSWLTLVTGIIYMGRSARNLKKLKAAVKQYYELIALYLVSGHKNIQLWHIWGKSHVLCVCSPILWIVCHSDPIGVIWGGGVTKRACGRRHTREGPCVQCVPGHSQTAAPHPQPQSNRNQVVSSEYCELPDSQLSLGNPIPVTKIVDWLPGMSTFSQPET